MRCEFFSSSCRLSIIASALLLGLLLGKADRVAALDPQRAISQYGHRTWTDRTGLPGQAVYEIIQPMDGYLYLRTGSRLVRFDGERFTPIDIQLDSQAIHESAKAIQIGADCQMLVRTLSHTLRHIDSRFSVALSPAPLPDGTPRSIYETPDHQIWIGSDCALSRCATGSGNLAAIPASCTRFSLGLWSAGWALTSRKAIWFIPGYLQRQGRPRQWMPPKTSGGTGLFTFLGGKPG